MASPQTAMKVRITDYVKQVCKAEGIKMPVLYIHFIRKSESLHGSFYPASLYGPLRVHVYVTTDDWDRAKWVTTHELAHVGAGRRAAHGEAFYLLFWKLCMKYHINLPIALDREASYKSRNALRYAKMAGVPGATAEARKVRTRKLQDKKWQAIVNQPEGWRSNGEFRIVKGKLTWVSYGQPVRRK